MESGDRLYRASAYAHFSGGMGDTVRTRFAMKRYDNQFMKIRLKKLSPDAMLPEYAHGPNEDAGMDLRSIAAVWSKPGVGKAGAARHSIQRAAGTWRGGCRAPTVVSVTHKDRAHTTQ